VLAEWDGATPVTGAQAVFGKLTNTHYKRLGGRERNMQNFRYEPQDIDNYRFMKYWMHRFF
jgi:hypothetical protein